MGHVSSAMSGCYEMSTFKIITSAPRSISQSYIHLYIVTWMLREALRSTLKSSGKRVKSDGKEDVMRGFVRQTGPSGQ
jgi:hypothetical protein